MPRDMHWDYVIILAVLGILVPWRSRARIQTLLQADSRMRIDRIRLYISTIMFQWTVSALVVWRWISHGQSLLGLALARPDVRRAILTVAVLSALLVVNQLLGMRRLASLPSEERGIVGRIAEKLVPQTPAEKWAGLVLVMSVATCEELIYRGFVQGLFESWLSAVWAGVIVSALFFAAAHWYQGRRGVLTTLIVGLIFSVVRVWTGSLLPSTMIHFVVDFSAGVASMRLAASGAELEGNAYEK